MVGRRRSEKIRDQGIGRIFPVWHGESDGMGVEMTALWGDSGSKLVV